MTKTQAFHDFLNNFLPSYEENSVPIDAALPYLTYMYAESDFDDSVSLQFSIWYKDTSWKKINEMAQYISASIGYGGKYIRCDEGAIWITKGTPFIQNVADTDEMIKRKLFNITAEFVLN